MMKFDKDIKDFLKKRMYYSKTVLKKPMREKIINYLFNHIDKKPEKFINKEDLKFNTKKRLISDFIAE